MAEQKHLTAAELITALQRLKPDAKVLINIKQFNKVYGVCQLPIPNTESMQYQMWVDASYRGATITVHLPESAYICKLPEKY